MPRFPRLFAAALMCLCALAQAQPYPSKPVKVIIPFTAGTSIDVVGRIVLDEVRKRTSLVSVVEYKPGALGAIGTDLVAKAPADGYTITVSSSATHSSGPQLAKSVPFDAVRDFTHLASLVNFDLILVVNADSSIRSVKDLVAAAKADPKRSSYGYGSATSRIGGSAVAKALGIQPEGIPYKGQPNALADLLSNQIQYFVADTGLLSAQIKAGKLRALGVLSNKRSTMFPDVPTLPEQDVRVELPGWVGLAGPANMPADVIAWWQKQTADALAAPETQQRLRALGFEPLQLSSPQFAQFVRTQYGVWGGHIKDAGITPE